MAVLDVKFERPITVFKPHDTLDIVDRYCGYDIAQYLRDLFDKYADEDRKLAAKADSDLLSYEKQVESNATAFQDLLAEIGEFEKEIGQSRLNREKLRKRLDAIATIINNQI
jgi:predicted RNase H-like nuclease (RuvC/YqgF family)